MQIEKIEVKNYKSLKDFTINNLHEINLIHGLNNSGKSNLLKFLKLVFGEKEIQSFQKYTDEDGELRTRRTVEQTLPFYDGVIYEPYIFWNNDRHNSISFSILIGFDSNSFPFNDRLIGTKVLNENGNKDKIEINGEIVSVSNLTSKIVLKRVKINSNQIFVNTTNNSNSGQYFVNSEIDPTLEKNSDLFYEIMKSFTNSVEFIDCDRQFIPESFSTNFDTLSSHNFKSWAYSLYIDDEKFVEFENLIVFLGQFKVSNNLKSKVPELQANLTNSPLNSIELGFSKISDEFELMLKSSNKRLPLRNYGTGIQQVIYLLFRVFNSKSKILVVEELELNLSPEYQQLIINNLKIIIEEKSTAVNQLFFTSHSDYLHRNDYRNFEISINENGESKSKVTEPQKYVNAKNRIHDFEKP